MKNRRRTSGKGVRTSFADYERDLKDPTIDINYILDKYFHTGQSNVFFGATPGDEAKLKEQVAAELFDAFAIRIHPLQLVLCGSAHLGFCPIPDERFGRPFDGRRSDIDIAVTCPELFDSWWSELQSIGLDPATREVVSRDLFWGFINPANLQTVGTLGPKWWALFGKLRTNRARGIRGRLYKNVWSMQSYHRLAVIGGRNRLLGGS